MAEFVYNKAKKDLADYSIVLTTGGTTQDATTHFLLLVTTGYNDVSNRDDQDFILTGTTADSIVHYEVSSSAMGSSARQDIGASTATEDDTGNLAFIEASTAITFSSVSSGVGDIGGAVIFAEVAASDSSGRVPVAFYDTNFPKTPNGGDITINFSTGGWLQYTS